MSLHHPTPLGWLLPLSPWWECLDKNFPTIDSPKTASRAPSEGIFFFKAQSPEKQTFINRLLKMTSEQEITPFLFFSPSVYMKTSTAFNKALSHQRPHKTNECACTVSHVDWSLIG